MYSSSLPPHKQTQKRGCNATVGKRGSVSATCLWPYELYEPPLRLVPVRWFFANRPKTITRNAAAKPISVAAAINEAASIGATLLDGTKTKVNIVSIRIPAGNSL
jgi:hypothetical protein